MYDCPLWRTRRSPALAPRTRALLVAVVAVAAPALAHAQAPAPRPLVPGARPTAPVVAAPAPASSEARALDEKLQALMARPGGLTSDEVAQRAEAGSVDIALRHAEINSAAAQVDQAMVAFFPRLAGVGRYTRLSDLEPPSLMFNGISVPFPKPLLNQTILQASLSVPLSDYVLRSMQGLAAASASRRAALANEQATRLKVRADARVLYYNWARTVLQEVVTSQALAQVRGHLGDVKHLLSAGMASPADVMRVESQAASAELLVERTHNLTRVMGEQLAIAMAEGDASDWLIGEDLRATLPQLPEVGADPVPLVAEALDHRLEPHVLDENRNAIIQQAKVVRAGQYPRLDVVGNLTYANPNQRIFPQQERFDFTWDVGVGLTWSPNDLGIARANARVIDSQVTQLEQQKRNLVYGLRAEVVSAWSAMREAKVELDTTARGLAASEESYRVRRELWKAGRATAVELTDAETDLTQARLSAVNANIDLRVAAVKLNHALGRDIEAGQVKRADR